MNFVNRCFLFGFAVVGGCGEASQEIHNLNGGRIEVIGHGGIGFQSTINPLVENSAASIYRALDAEGADGVEVDVRFSADGVPVLFHDTEMASNSTCQGCISTMTAGGIAACRFRDGYLGNPVKQASILTLHRIVDEFSRRKPVPRLYLDVKVLDNCTPALKAEVLDYVVTLEKLIRRYDAYDWIIVQLGTLSMVTEMVRLNPRVKVLLSVPNFSTALRLADELDLFGIVLHQQSVSAREVARAHARGLWVVLYGAKSRDSAVSGVNMSPDSIHTDRVRVLRAVLNP